NLHDALVLVLSFDDGRPLGRVVRERLLNVNILAGVARVDGDRHMPVVRRADEHGVHVLVVENLFVFLRGDRLWVGEFLAFSQADIPYVADGGDADVGNLDERFHQLPATAAGADAADVENLVGPEDAVVAGRGQGESGGRLQKSAARGHGMSPNDIH